MAAVKTQPKGCGYRRLRRSHGLNECCIDGAVRKEVTWFRGPSRQVAAGFSLRHRTQGLTCREPSRLRAVGVIRRTERACLGQGDAA